MQYWAYRIWLNKQVKNDMELTVAAKMTQQELSAFTIALNKSTESLQKMDELNGEVKKLTEEVKTLRGETERLKIDNDTLREQLQNSGSKGGEGK